MGLDRGLALPLLLLLSLFGEREGRTRRAHNVVVPFLRKQRPRIQADRSALFPSGAHGLASAHEGLSAGAVGGGMRQRQRHASGRTEQPGTTTLLRVPKFT